MKTYKLNFYGTDYVITLAKGSYLNNGTLCVEMYTVVDGVIDELFGTLTVNLETKEDIIKMATDEYQYIDTNNLGYEILDWAIKNGIAEDCYCYRHSGFCDYPLVRFKASALKQMTNL